MVVHLATLTTPSLGERNVRLELENQRFALDLIYACRRQKVARVVFASSGGTLYGETGSRPAIESDPVRPSCAYAITKFVVEQHLRLAAEHGALSATALRLGNVYGGAQRVKGEQGVVGFLIGQMGTDTVIPLWGDTIRDYLHVDDASDALVCAIRDQRPGFHFYNVATGKGTPLTQLARDLCELAGRPPHLCVMERRPFDLACNLLDSSKARAELGWTATLPLAEGLSLAMGEARR